MSQSQQPNGVLQTPEFLLSQVIDRDPLTWTDTDIDGLVNYYRQYRIKFLQEDNKARAAGKPLQSKSVKAKLNFDDLYKE